MRLIEHRDFQQAIVQAAEHFAERGLRPALIEKDYYVTEALRVIAATVGDKIIFKGGTSLSKGWNLIQRFSEDVDIFLDPRAFDPVLGRNGINRELKALRDAVAAQPGLTSCLTRARRSADSGDPIDSRTSRYSVVPAKWPEPCSSRRNGKRS